MLSASGADETLLVFGGNTFDPVNQLFAYSVARAEWSQLKPAGEPPSKRYGHAAAATTDGRMVVFGGYNGSHHFDDTWLFDTRKTRWLEKRQQVLPRLGIRRSRTGSDGGFQRCFPRPLRRPLQEAGGG